MTIDEYFPFDSGAGANSSEDAWVKMARFWAPNGVDFSSAYGIMIAFGDSSGMQVKVNPGEVYVNGQLYRFDTQKIKAIATSHATLDRIDRVVARADRTANTVTIEILTGTPGASPTAPALTQTSSTYEVSLAQVAVAHTVTTITAANVTDERPVSLGIDGVGGNYVKLAETRLGADTTTLSWGSIPQTFRHLEIVASARSSVSARNLSAIFNGTTGTAYDLQVIVASNGSVTAARTINQAWGLIGYVNGSGAVDTAYWAPYTARIFDYAGSHYKAMRSVGVDADGDSPNITDATTTFQNTAPITSMTLQIDAGTASGLKSGSLFTLYGIR